MVESCPICTKEFATKDELKQHWFKDHNLDPESTWPLSEKRMNCDTCAKVRGSTCPRIKRVGLAQCRDWKPKEAKPT